ncbi:MAG: diaminopimelate epimerase [Pyrinomonadaceae bacterium]|jgi:diaminopimelate epimerase|nr:diaminopimelate epimerase [Pyrinomonadaceae bacterium]
MNFVKFHGYGNDYIVCETGELAGVAGADVPEFVRRVCDRHYGVGGDGVATLEPASAAAGDAATAGDPAADFVLRIFNPDGSEAAMSGNGSRSAAAFLYFQGLWQQDELRLATKAGVKLYRLLEQDGRGRYRFAAEIGRPAFDSATIPMLTGAAREQVSDFPLELETGETVRLTALQMCNPNACVFVDDFDRADWRRIGRAIESHTQFPQRTNVEFVRVRDRETIEVRVYERGVGPTLSSGTGACAAAVASCLNGLTDRRVRVEMEGGRLEVEWRDDGEVLLTGDAEVIYRGEWLKGKG